MSNTESVKSVQPGIFDGVSFEEYKKIDAANKSILDKVERSPAHAWEEKQNPSEPTEAMIFGSAFHDALLLPTEFDNRYAVSQKFDRRTTEGKKAAQEFETKNAGKTIITEDQKQAIDGMIAAVRAHKEANSLVRAGTSELACFWNDKDTGTMCKARPDLLTDSGTIVDVKTTSDASFKEFQRSIANFRYHVQGAFYLDGVNNFHKADSFVIVAVEKKPPYAVAVYSLDYATLEKGREDYKRNLAAYTECVKTGQWPAYSEEIQSMNLPAWSW